MTLLSEKAPVFVLGCPRSGTTFLSSILLLTDYGPPFESQFIDKYFDELGGNQDLSNRDLFVGTARRILRERAVRQWGTDIDVGRLFDELPQKSYSTLVDAVCLALVRSRRPGAIAWGDKTPRYTLRWDVLVSLYPGSKFIYISRDGRDVALSLMERPWGPATVLAAARLWRSYIRVKRDLRDRLDPDQLHFVGYERLLESPAEQIARIYQFLDVEISTDEIAGLAATARRDNAFKWRERMSEADRRVFELAVGNTLEDEGYETLTPEGPLPVTTELSSGLVNGAKRGRHLLTQNLVDPIAIRFFGKEPFND